MEGKEIRFGSFYSAFYSSINMIIPAGTINGMHDQLMPLSAMGCLSGMQVDAFFGGSGTGWIQYVYLPDFSRVYSFSNDRQKLLNYLAEKFRW